MGAARARYKFIGVLLSSLVGIGFWGWAFITLSAGVERSRSGIRDLQVEIQQQETEERFARLAAQMFRERSRDLSRLDEIFISRARPIAFLERLEEMARATRNKLVVNVTEPGLEEMELTFRLTVDGTLASIRQYLKLVETLPHLLRVDDLSIQRIDLGGRPGSAGADEKTHRLTLLIRVAARGMNL